MHCVIPLLPFVFVGVVIILGGGLRSPPVIVPETPQRKCPSDVWERTLVFTVGVPGSFERNCGGLGLGYMWRDEYDKQFLGNVTFKRVPDIFLEPPGSCPEYISFVPVRPGHTQWFQWGEYDFGPKDCFLEIYNIHILPL